MMKLKKTLCMLALICLMVTAVSPGFGQETGAETDPISEEAFSRAAYGRLPGIPD